MSVSPASTVPLTLAATLQSIRGLTALDPRTLDHGFASFEGINALAVSLRGTELSKLGAQIEHLAAAAARGDERAKTLPQAKQKLEAINALLPALPGVSGATPAAALPSRASTAPAPSAPAVQASSALYDRYSALTGSARHQFFSANREALVREHTRRATAPTAQQSDVLAKYQTLTGAERQAFYAQHERELWSAFRASRRAA